MLGGERFQLADQLGVLAERQVGLDALCQTVEARLLQAGDLGLGEGLVAEVGQRRAPPHRQRLAQYGAAADASPAASCRLPSAWASANRAASSCSGSISSA